MLQTSVGLVNALTAGEAGGRPVAAPNGAERVAAVERVLTRRDGGRPHVKLEDAAALSAVAETLRRVFELVDAGDTAAAAAAVNALLRESGARPQLDSDPEHGWQMHFHGADDSLVVGWTAGCATGLALAMGSELVGRLGVCSAEHCDRVYVDASRNGARRYCSTACQNRTKAAAFRARSQQRP